ncbi:MAG: VapC toxin family PIN domain ribonuclease [Gammaproteobacteria bacterium HGW-Gammaproteobacteria-2]|nr:MAG: VapC toxin family PIN domain ribonuclease [Gammaproteobacteria bacterium HGW-Gammaproteobacteria-2]
MIFLDTNVISETLRKAPDAAVMNWLAVHDDSLAIPTVTIAEIAFGIAKIRPDERSLLLQRGLDAWRSRFAGRIFPFTEQAALIYSDLMGAAHHAGRALSAPDGMIAAIAIVNQGRLASRNTRDFGALPVPLINPWDDILP